MEDEVLGAPARQPQWVGSRSSWSHWGWTWERGCQGCPKPPGSVAQGRETTCKGNGHSGLCWCFGELLEDPEAGTGLGGLRSFGRERRRAAFQRQKLFPSPLTYRSKPAWDFGWVQRGVLVPLVTARTPVSSPHIEAQVGQQHPQPLCSRRKEKCIDSLPGSFQPIIRPSFCFK